jgi:regulator of ribonuclease activity A
VEFATADLCDAFADQVQVLEPVFREYGGVPRFSGAIETLRVFEDNTLVGQALETDGQGRVLVVDGGGSLRCALLGGRLGALAQRNGWAGVLVNGCVRDVDELRVVRIGIRALNISPRRSEKRGTGLRGATVSFAGASIAPGKFLYADGDGIIVSERDLLLR